MGCGFVAELPGFTKESLARTKILALLLFFTQLCFLINIDFIS